MTQPTRKLTMGSLFDGISGFPLASVRYGIEPIWASEIEPFPILVSKIRFPRGHHLRGQPVPRSQLCWLAGWSNRRTIWPLYGTNTDHSGDARCR